MQRGFRSWDEVGPIRKTAGDQGGGAGKSSTFDWETNSGSTSKHRKNELSSGRTASGRFRKSQQTSFSEDSRSSRRVSSSRSTSRSKSRSPVGRRLADVHISSAWGRPESSMESIPASPTEREVHMTALQQNCKRISGALSTDGMGMRTADDSFVDSSGRASPTMRRNMQSWDSESKEKESAGNHLMISTDQEKESSDTNNSKSIGVDAAPASPDLWGSVIQPIVDWLCAGRKLDPFCEIVGEASAIDAADILTKEEMDTISSKSRSCSGARGIKIAWQSAHGMTLVCGVFVFVLFVLGAVVLTSMGSYGSGVVSWVATVILAALFSWVRYENQRVGCEEKVRGMKIEEVLHIVDWVLVFLIFTMPIAFHFTIGMSESIGSLAWTSLSPAYMIKMAITERIGKGGLNRRSLRQRKMMLRVKRCNILMGAAVVFAILITGLYPEIRHSDSEDWSVLRYIFMSNFLMVPAVLGLIFSWLNFKFETRNHEIVMLTKQSLQQLTLIENLVSSLVPPFRSKSLMSIKPRDWHTTTKDLYDSCTIIQMDMSGFTKMSSKISAEELVTLIHAIFTSIDYLAECMGNIWKVETVGDCYIGVVGGPNPCEDHAHRAVVFALSILDNVKRISAKTGVPLKIRVGVHSGSITAAFVGQMLPRYLIFGPDVEIVRQMEAAARPGVVGLTDATAKLLPRDWVLTPGNEIVCENQGVISTRIISMSNINYMVVNKSRQLLYPKLGNFHKWFCASVANLGSQRSHSPAASSQLSSFNFRNLGHEKSFKSLFGAKGTNANPLTGDSKLRRIRSKRSKSFQAASGLTKPVDEAIKGVQSVRRLSAPLFPEGLAFGMTPLGDLRNTASSSVGHGNHAVSDARRSTRNLAGQIFYDFDDHMDNIEEGNCEVSTHPQRASDEVERSASDRGLQASVKDDDELGRDNAIVTKKANGTRRVAHDVHGLPSEDAVNGSRMHGQTSKDSDLEVGKGEIEEVEGSASLGTMVDEIVVDISKDEVGQEPSASEPVDQEQSYFEPVMTPGEHLAALKPIWYFSRCASVPSTYVPSSPPLQSSNMPESEGIAFTRQRSKSLEVHRGSLLPGKYATGKTHMGSIDSQVQQSLASIFSDLKNIGKTMQSMDSAGSAGNGNAQRLPSAGVGTQLSHLYKQYQSENSNSGSHKSRSCRSSHNRLESSIFGRASQISEESPAHGSPVHVSIQPTASAAQSPGLQPRNVLQDLKWIGFNRADPTSLRTSPALSPNPRVQSALVQSVEGSTVESMLHPPALDLDAGCIASSVPVDGSIGLAGRENTLQSLIQKKQILDVMENDVIWTSRDSRGSHRHLDTAPQDSDPNPHDYSKNVPIHPQIWSLARSQGTDLQGRGDQCSYESHTVEGTVSPTLNSYSHGVFKKINSFFHHFSNKIKIGIHNDMSSLWTGTNAIGMNGAPPSFEQGNFIRDWTCGVTSSGDPTTSVQQFDNGSSFFAPQKEQNDDEHERDEGEDVFEWVDVMAHQSRLQAEKVQMLLPVFAAMLGAIVRCIVFFSVGYSAVGCGMATAFFALLFLQLILVVFCDFDSLDFQRTKYSTIFLLVVSPFFFAGSFDWHHAISCVMWGLLGVELQLSLLPSSAMRNFCFACTAAVTLVNIIIVSVLNNWIFLTQPPGWVLALVAIDFAVPMMLSVYLLNNLLYHFIFDEGNLNGLLSEKISHVTREHELLEALMPPTIADRLRAGEEQIADGTDDTTVMFVYIDGYSELLASHGTDKTIEWLDSVFCMYDRMISRRFAGKVVKIETLSNFYLAASGCPIPTKDHAMECISAVIYLLKATRLVRRPDGGPTTVRAGLCSGPTCAGVIGNACPRFSIFGDTVNTASRMASTADSSDYNLECSVHLTESTMGLLSQDFLDSLEESEGWKLSGGQKDIKGKGIMKTYVLSKLGRHSPRDGSSGRFFNRQESSSRSWADQRLPCSKIEYSRSLDSAISSAIEGVVKMSATSSGEPGDSNEESEMDMGAPQ